MPRKTKPFAIAVVGPTASGKSDLAVRLAKKFNGEVISADSRQVYKGLDICSGKITKKEMKGIPHYLLDVASPKRVFTVSQYQKLGQKAIKDILKRGKLPIICGGTGFYIDALVSNLKFPEVPPQKELRKKLEKKSAESLFKKLKKLDSHRAKNIDRHNKRRLVRALEIVLTTKKPVPLSTMTRHSSQYDVLKIGIKKNSDELKKLIHNRLIKRLEQGMIKEVENLHRPPAGGGLSWKRLDDLGLEYRYVSRYLHSAERNKKPRLAWRGLISKEEMTKSIEKESWQYAKRQITWLRRDKNVIWTKDDKEAESLVKKFLEK